MSSIRYYLTYPDRKALENAKEDLGGHSGNVIAAFTGPMETGQGLSLGAWVPTGNKPNSKVTKGKISLMYLVDYCRAISEQDARTIHPRLFSAMPESNNREY